MFGRRRSSADQKMMDRVRERHMTGIREAGHHGSASGARPNRRAQSGGRNMIRVTRLNGELLFLNILQIETMESIPETKIKMMHGDYYLVKDTAESVMEQVRKFYRSCIVHEDENK